MNLTLVLNFIQVIVYIFIILKNFKTRKFNQIKFFIGFLTLQELCKNLNLQIKISILSLRDWSKQLNFYFKILCAAKPHFWAKCKLWSIWKLMVMNKSRIILHHPGTISFISMPLIVATIICSLHMLVKKLYENSPQELKCSEQVKGTYETYELPRNAWLNCIFHNYVCQTSDKSFSSMSVKF